MSEVEVHVFSLKVGNAHGLWQYKLSGSHDRVMLHSLRHILGKTCQLLGLDFPGSISCFSFLLLRRTFTAQGLFPLFVNTRYLARGRRRSTSSSKDQYLGESSTEDIHVYT